MESSLKTWLLRLIVIVPILCLIIGVVMWKNTDNGAFDIQKVKQELKAEFDNKIQKLQNEVNNLHAHKRELQTQIDLSNVKFQQQQQQIKTDKTIFRRQLKEVKDSTSSRNREKRAVRGGGAVFVHWGRMNCSSTTDLVYSGIAGGGLYSHTGSAVNMLCMTHNPVWAKYGTDANYYSFLYGTEYHVHSNDFPFGHDRAEKLHLHDVPCSVCRSATRTSGIMIPGTTECTAGWTAEYSGYLMAGHYPNPAATEYNCIDANPDALESGAALEWGRLLVRVKGKCGSLPCPPYSDMREITCVVCTK